MSFNNLPLHERLHRALGTAGYTSPTPIQAAALPVALAGNDIVGTAQTGTGKTAAFVLPILQRIMASPERSMATRALILAPTRELAEQIHASIQQLGIHTNIRSATVYGGVGMALQERALRKGAEIIVACPGRLLDHVDRGYVDFSQLDCLVLDEADRMLDMGFLPPITKIIKMLPAGRQTMLFSATFAQELQSFVRNNLQNPQRIDIGLSAPAETVEHALYPVPQHLKTSLLIAMLRRMDTESVLIFTRTKHRANRVMEQLVKQGYDAGVLHSNKSQNQRQLTLDNFRAGKLRILVATDIVARGIDVTTISHVINYDIPDCADSYIHRIGRTGRMERTGEALTFVTHDDASTIRDIERALRASIETRTLDEFDYKQPAPHADEFKRAPQPPRRAPKAAAPAPARAAAAPAKRTGFIRADGKNPGRSRELGSREYSRKESASRATGGRDAARNVHPLETGITAAPPQRNGNSRGTGNGRPAASSAQPWSGNKSGGRSSSPARGARRF
ncbi:MAG: DEAD/DEAH box helicase [Armatimonadota bacterium]